MSLVISFHFLCAQHVSGINILMSETCWAHKKWNKIASDIKSVFYSSTIAMMHGPINIRCVNWICVYLAQVRSSAVRVWTQRWKMSSINSENLLLSEWVCIFLCRSQCYIRLIIQFKIYKLLPSFYSASHIFTSKLRMELTSWAHYS